MPVQSRGQHAGIVKHHAIAGAQVFWQIPKLTVFDTLRVAMQHQHAGSVTLLRRLLRD